jgi:D-glycero-D-manno-heptose 1,7-bisphosphate phosphatase
MTKQFRLHGIKIEEVQYCPHSPDENCICRKPNTGMIDNILKKYSLDLKRSWLIGDKQSDIDLAKHTGIGSTIAVGERPINNATFYFSTILETKRFLEENQDIIKS